jgi:PAS domain S-box-containing protein
MLSSDEIAYVEFNLALLNPKLISGTMKPLIMFANQMEIANVFQNLFENNHHGILITNSETKILACNRYFEKQMGVEIGSLLGKNTKSFNAGIYSKEFYQNMWVSINEYGHWTGTILNKRPNGDVVPHELTIHKISPIDGSGYYLGLTVDLNNQLSRIVDTELGGIDLLTKQPVKERFLEDVKVFCQKTGHHSGKILLVLKPTFDSENYHKHLIEFSDTLHHVRLCQVTGYLGEGVFAICTEYIFQKNSEQSRAIRSALRYMFQDLKFHSKDYIYEALSLGKVGVSVLGLDSQTPEELLNNSTLAMLEGHAGENRHINFYYQAIHDDILRKKTLEELIIQAVKGELLDVYYQPIVSANTGELIKFEALCRFPTFGELEANVEEIISIAEDLDLITALDHCICVKALEGLKTLHKTYGSGLGLTINCSLNTKQDSAEVIRKYNHLIAANTNTPNLITVELTESAYFNNQTEQSKALITLHNMGIKVAIDDFGTGYSSFSYLTEGLFDILKIDRMFVTNIHKDTNKPQLGIKIELSACSTIRSFDQKK